jgi:hypothetical protein
VTDTTRRSNPYWYRKERKPERQRHFRAYRKAMRRLLASGAFERLRPYRRTQGWLTW